jgi:hypothetical protein
MAADLSDRLRSMEDVAAMVEAATPKSAKRGPYKRRIAHCCEIMFRIVAIAVTGENGKCGYTVITRHGHSAQCEGAARPSLR